MKDIYIKNTDFAKNICVKSAGINGIYSLVYKSSKFLIKSSKLLVKLTFETLLSSYLHF